MKKLILVLAVLVALPVVAKKPRRAEIIVPETAKFVRDSAWIKGAVVNYNPSFPFSTGLLYLNDPFTDEEMTQSFSIAADGTFEIGFPAWFPWKVSMGMDGVMFNFYVEPGKTLEVAFVKGKPQFAGDLAQENTEMSTFERTGVSASRYQELSQSADWQMVQGVYRGILEENLRRLAEAHKAGSISDKMYGFLRYSEQARFVEDVLRYGGTNFKYYHSGAVPPMEFYDFLHEMPLDDPEFLYAADTAVPNFIRTMWPMSGWQEQSAVNIYYNPDGEVDFHLADFLEDKDNELSADERWWLTVSHEALKDSLTRERYAGISTKFYPRLLDMAKEHMRTRQDTPEVSNARRQLAYADSVWVSLMGREPGLMMDFVAMRELDDIQRFANGLTPAQIVQMHREVYDHVRHPFMRDEVWVHYESMLPRLGNKAIAVPEGPAKDILNGIIGKFKGKPVLVDFWGTGCGPCIAAIRGNKESRAKIEAKGEMAIVFITSPSNSPSETRYNQFVDENAMTNSYRVTEDEWNLLSALFGISGIPRYVLFDEHGDVLDDHHSGSMWEFL